MLQGYIVAKVSQIRQSGLNPLMHYATLMLSISCFGERTMEFKGQGPTSPNTNHVSQPQPQPRPVVSRAGERESFGMMNHHEGNKKIWIVAIIIAAVLALGGLGWWAYNTFMSPDGVKKGQYQAIFLTNGQVYFGKLSGVNDSYIDLTDIYYLQVQQSVQPDANKTATENPQVSLAKLGSELHGPEDQMKINRDQVLFWENLKDNGKVVEAIKKNQQGQ